MSKKCFGEKDVDIRALTVFQTERDVILKRKAKEKPARMYKRWGNAKLRKQRAYEDAVKNLESKGIL